MAKDPQFRAAMREWLSGHPEYKNIREAASGIGIPFETLRKYFSGRRPSDKNLRILTEATNVTVDREPRPPKSEKSRAGGQTRAARILDELQYDLARCIASIPAVQETLNDGLPKGRISARRKGQQIQALMDALQKHLAAVLRDPEALALVRSTVSGSDAGYLSGLLAALFDDRRLRTWVQMTTYQYGSK